MDSVQKWFSCGRKKSWTTRKAANKTAKKYNLRVYKCDACNKFHTTKVDRFEYTDERIV